MKAIEEAEQKGGRKARRRKRESGCAISRIGKNAEAEKPINKTPNKQDEYNSNDSRRGKRRTTDTVLLSDERSGNGEIQQPTGSGNRAIDTETTNGVNIAGEEIVNKEQTNIGKTDD